MAQFGYDSPGFTNLADQFVVSVLVAAMGGVGT